MENLESIRKNNGKFENTTNYKTVVGEQRGVNGRVLMRVYLIKNRIGYYIVFQHYKLKNPYIIYPRDIETMLSSNFQERSQIATKLLTPIPSNHKKARRYLFKALGIIKAREYLNLVYS